MLFDSTSLGDLTFENRVGLAPMTRVSATADGRATDRMAQYYSKFAEGGFSFLVTEGVYTDDVYSKEGVIEEFAWFAESALTN